MVKAVPVMHDDELAVPDDLVRALLREQFPRWADLPLHRVASTGTDNAVFRLGNDLGLRLPKVEWPVEAIAHEHRWLPVLAPLLPLELPVPVGDGRPSADYPWPWTVYPWLTGANPGIGSAPDDLVDDLIQFRRALAEVPIDGAPAAGRGEPIRLRDRQNRAGLQKLVDISETATPLDALASCWDEIVTAEDHVGPAEWVHGDLTPGNVLLRPGRAAVIDWTLMGVGDPAVELLPAWNLFDGNQRRRYRETLGIDDNTWLRGRGWAMTMSLAALPYYRVTNPPLAAMARHVLRQLVDDPD